MIPEGHRRLVQIFPGLKAVTGTFSQLKLMFLFILITGCIAFANGGVKPLISNRKLIWNSRSSRPRYQTSDRPPWFLLAGSLKLISRTNVAIRLGEERTLARLLWLTNGPRWGKKNKKNCCYALFEFHPPAYIFGPFIGCHPPDVKNGNQQNSSS